MEMVMKTSMVTEMVMEMAMETAMETAMAMETLHKMILLATMDLMGNHSNIFYFFNNIFLKFKIFHKAIQAINLKHKTTSSSQVMEIMEIMVLMDIQAIDLKMISNNHHHRSIVQQINMFHHKTIHRNGRKKSLQPRNNSVL